MEYQELEKELEKKYHHSKIVANKAFIKDIIKILYANDSGVQIAKKAYEEATERYNASEETREVLMKQARDDIIRCQRIEKENDELKKYKECETEKARDKLRLADYFRYEIGEDLNGYQYTEFIKGLALILGNGREEE